MKRIKRIKNFETSNDLIYHSMSEPVIDDADSFVAIDVLGEPSSSYRLFVRAPSWPALRACLPDERQPSNDPDVSPRLQ